MPDQFCKDTVYIVSKSVRKYDVLQTQNGVVFKKRKTPAILPDYVKPRPKPFTAIPPEDKVVSIVTRPNNIVNVKPNQETNTSSTSVSSPISNSSSFEDLKKKVEEMRKKEAEKKVQDISVEKTNEITDSEEDVAIVTIEDADELASGAISEEQELVNKEYLKSLSNSVLKKVYYVCAGKKANKDISKFELRKDILKVYNESNANRKKVIYEASRTSV